VRIFLEVFLTARVVDRMKKVGWIFAQSSEEREFIVSSQELRQIAEIQHEVGEFAVTAVVSLDTTEAEGHVHFEVHSETEVAAPDCLWFRPTSARGNVSLFGVGIGLSRIQI